MAEQKIDELEISEEEANAVRIINSADRPNAFSSYRESKKTAADVKKMFDAPFELVKNKFNGLVIYIKNKFAAQDEKIQSQDDTITERLAAQDNTITKRLAAQDNTITERLAAQDRAIENFKNETIGDISSALDELHDYAQNIMSGEES